MYINSGFFPVRLRQASVLKRVDWIIYVPQYYMIHNIKQTTIRFKVAICITSLTSAPLFANTTKEPYWHQCLQGSPNWTQCYQFGKSYNWMWLTGRNVARKCWTRKPYFWCWNLFAWITYIYNIHIYSNGCDKKIAETFFVGHLAFPNVILSTNIEILFWHLLFAWIPIFFVCFYYIFQINLWYLVHFLLYWLPLKVAVVMTVDTFLCSVRPWHDDINLESNLRDWFFFSSNSNL